MAKRYIIRFGKSGVCVYYTQYHADQMMRALHLNGTAATLEVLDKLACQMKTNCTGNVTHIDTKGFVYCSAHGIQRQQYSSCRKMTIKEIATL